MELCVVEVADRALRGLCILQIEEEMRHDRNGASLWHWKQKDNVRAMCCGLKFHTVTHPKLAKPKSFWLASIGVFDEPGHTQHTNTEFRTY